MRHFPARHFASSCRRAVSAVLVPVAIAAGLTAGIAATIATATPAEAAATHDNTVYAFGAATFHGSTQNMRLAHPIVAMAATANGAGYWLVGIDGAVFSFNAPYYGGLYPFPTTAPIVGMTATPTGHGYWLVGSDGHVYPFGDAHQYGGLQGKHLNAPITSLIAGPGAKGYWLYAGDGGVFTFGSARFHGSTGNIRLHAPVVGMAATPSGNGYWLVASDGGVFTFGDAVFRGSTGNVRLHAPVVGMARTGSGKGYWLAGADGGVFTFGDAQFKGSAVGQLAPFKSVVSLVGMPAGNGYRMLALLPLFPPAPPRPPDVALQGPGATGAAVLALQNRLIAQGYWLGAADGAFGNLTQQAVWAFQKANGIPRTGVIDPLTQQVFRTAPRPRPRSTSGYVIEIDKTRQILMVASNGYASWTFSISSGSDHPYSENGTSGNAHTPEGVFSIIRQVNGWDTSPLGHLWRPKYFTWQGHAIHGYTSVPPYPASHGCVRISIDAMNWLWDSNTLPLGTTVWVYV